LGDGGNFCTAKGGAEKGEPPLFHGFFQFNIRKPTYQTGSHTASRDHPPQGALVSWFNVRNKLKTHESILLTTVFVKKQLSCKSLGRKHFANPQV